MENRNKNSTLAQTVSRVEKHAPLMIGLGLFAIILAIESCFITKNIERIHANQTTSAGNMTATYGAEQFYGQQTAVINVTVTSGANQFITQLTAQVTSTP